MRDTIMRILLRGDMVSIDELVKFTPVVKAVISNTEDGITAEKPRTNVRCSVLAGFKESFQKRVELQKVEASEVIPRLKNVYSGLEKHPLLRASVTNNISGNRLKAGNMALSGLRLNYNGNGNGSAETVTFAGNQLALDYYTDKLLVFSFKKDTNFPDWLTEELPVDVSLLYSHEGRTIETSRVTCKWTNNE